MCAVHGVRPTRGGLIRAYRRVGGFLRLFPEIVLAHLADGREVAVRLYVRHVSGDWVVLVCRLRSCGPNCRRSTRFSNCPRIPRGATLVPVLFTSL